MDTLPFMVSVKCICVQTQLTQIKGSPARGQPGFSRGFSPCSAAVAEQGELCTVTKRDLLLPATSRAITTL